jgi:hypothetical protein
LFNEVKEHMGVIVKRILCGFAIALASAVLAFVIWLMNGINLEMLRVGSVTILIVSGFGFAFGFVLYKQVWKALDLFSVFWNW